MKRVGSCLILGLTLLVGPIGCRSARELTAPEVAITADQHTAGPVIPPPDADLP